MIYKGLDRYFQDSSPINVPSLNVSSRDCSPISSKKIVNISMQSQYKSPQTTPVKSGLPIKKPTLEQFQKCLSSKKLPKNEEIIERLYKKLEKRERRIKQLEEENKRLLAVRPSDNWEKELVKRNSEIRKLESQLKRYKELAVEKKETDSLMETIDKQNKQIFSLEGLLKEMKTVKCLEHASIIEELKRDNLSLIENLSEHNSCLKREDCEVLQKHIRTLEVNLESQESDNKALKEEIKSYNQKLPIGSLLYFTQDISKIRKEIQKLLGIISDLKAGKEISLKSLLGIENDKKQEPAQQLSNDITCIKYDINSIFTIIADFHADQYANSACANQ